MDAGIVRNKCKKILVDRTFRHLNWWWQLNAKFYCYNIGRSKHSQIPRYVWKRTNRIVSKISLIVDQAEA